MVTWGVSNGRFIFEEDADGKHELRSNDLEGHMGSLEGDLAEDAG
jgi:hypothetical protein